MMVLRFYLSGGIGACGRRALRAPRFAGAVLAGAPTAWLQLIELFGCQHEHTATAALELKPSERDARKGSD
jgi:hypothetical protein